MAMVIQEETERGLSKEEEELVAEEATDLGITIPEEDEDLPKEMKDLMQEVGVVLPKDWKNEVH